MSPAVVIIAVLAYIGLLFWTARRGDKRQFVEGSWPQHPIVYALALGVYCTSWTFYGLVGTASQSGWSYLPILLGPILLFTFGYPLLERMGQICKQENVHSIADFLSSRYGKRQGVAATTTLVVLLATVPYIALQLKAVSDTLVLTMGDMAVARYDITFLVAVSMVAFALLFGTKRLDVSGYHAGLMSAIAFESLVKLIALGSVALVAIWVWSDIDSEELLQRAGQPFAESTINLRFVVETVISACAIFCLPRMFHVTFVERISDEHLKTARWAFSGYLALVMCFVLVIAWVGNAIFYDSGVSGDSYVLALPLARDMPAIATLAFLGGFSAATAMIIVATVTLSQMLSNDVILPLLIKRASERNRSRDYSPALMFARRMTVVLIVILAYVYQATLAGNAALTSIGLIAFALAVQLAPAILLGLVWRRGNALGVYAGLVAGGSIWFYTLMLPLLVEAGALNPQLLESGLANVSWLRPEYLFDFEFSDSYTRGMLISIACNLAAYVGFSLLDKTHLSDRIQSLAFCRRERQVPGYQGKRPQVFADDLRALLQQFIGPRATSEVFQQAGDEVIEEPVAADVLERAEHALAGVVGVASARSMIATLHEGEGFGVEDVVNIFEETTKALRFNQDILFASFENISSAISVANESMEMVAWNKRYEDMFNYPKGMLTVGASVADLVRFNSERGMMGPGSTEDHVQKRITYLRAAKPYRIVRSRGQGSVIEIKGTPLPNGGYVTTYDDITEFISAQKQLEEANEYLEERVQERTKTIENINFDLRTEIERRKKIESELVEAKMEAEQANKSKSRFLALASHDILQPLNAANLYVSTLMETDVLEGAEKKVVRNLRSAIQSSETIISSLFEIAKLDTGTLKPHPKVFAVDDLLQPLYQQFSVQCAEGVEMHYVPCSLFVETDQGYLRRIVQNFMSNAVKYTDAGKILVGCRRRSWGLEICVYDSGPGISTSDQRRIFEDFFRASTDTEGAGLGLGVASRFSKLLGLQIRMHSTLNLGSFFSVSLPVATGAAAARVEQAPLTSGELAGLSVLYVDDDEQNLSALASLLERWDCHIVTLNSVLTARKYLQENSPPRVLLMDYQLGDDATTGIQLAEEMQRHWGSGFAVCIVSAAQDEGLPILVEEKNYHLLRKPVKPGKLKALLQQVNKRI